MSPGRVKVREIRDQIKAHVEKLLSDITQSRHALLYWGWRFLTIRRASLVHVKRKKHEKFLFEKFLKSPENPLHSETNRRIIESIYSRRTSVNMSGVLAGRGGRIPHA
jgi:hypothetical protein